MNAISQPRPNNIFLTLGFACLSLGLVLPAWAGEVVYRVPRTAKAPTIDGRIEPGEWQTAAGFEGFMKKDGLERRRARAWVAADATTIYVAIMTQLPDEGALTAAVDSDSLKAVYDDSVEIFVNPTPDAPDRVDYQFVVNSRGRGGYAINKLGNPTEAENWRGNWPQANGLHDGWWHFEAAIPIASMGLVEKGRQTTDGVWTLNLCRDWKPDWGWSSLNGGYVNKGVRFVFTADPTPAVQVACRADPTFPPFEQVLTVSNPTPQPLPVKALLRLFRNNMPELKAEKTLTLAPGAREELTLAVPQSPTTIFDLTARVTSADEAVVFYDRQTKWNLAKSPLRWVVGRLKETPPVDLQFAYYPSKNRLRLVVDINGLAKDAKPTKVTAVVRERLERQEVKSVDLPLTDFKDGRQELSVDLPPLDGLYEIAVMVAGEKTPTGATIKTFERRRFPWENSPVGRSTKVYAPFTPITVKDRTLNTVLRQHTLNDLGLVDQIAATSANTGVTKPILAAPMRYTAKVAGAVVPVQVQPLKIVSAKPNEVITDSAFTAGALQVTGRQTWDYDGTVKVELTLLPTDGQAVDELTLEIPFSAASAPLLHANADRIRAPIAIPTPTGAGVVWDAGKVACDDYIRNFCPYIYLGSAVRGLCWFAENDKDWGWNSQTPNLDVVRDGDQVILRVHLVNQPTVLSAARTLTFGLLAAPVKPMLNTDTADRHWWRYRYLRDNYTLLGTDINWFGNNSCGTVYPVGQDLYLWEMLARANRAKLPESEIAAFVSYGEKYFRDDPRAEYGRTAVQTWRDTASGNLGNAPGKKLIFYYNRASSQELPEFETFQDEWCLGDRRETLAGGRRSEIKSVPTDSFDDFNLYWYARSFEIGNNRGVYWDNWFITPSFNTAMTAAYRRPDGTVAPAAGIWALRELAKRTFVMMNERGMTPITFPHMTSFSPLPMLAFATVQYDWEWKYSEGDVQNRFTREYLLLASTGELAGVWPVPLHDHGAKADDPWEQRTFSAVRIVHELDGIGGWGRDWMKSNARNRQALAAPVLAMLDRPGLQVYKYWEDRPQPVTTTNPDVPTIVYCVPGKETLVAVVSYARQDENVTVQVDLSALDLAAGSTVSDVEAQQTLTLKERVITLPLRKHDIRLLRFTKGD